MGSLWEELREARAHNDSWSSPGCQALVVHRLTGRAKQLPQPFRLPARVVCRLLYVFVRNVYTIELPSPVKIGRRFRIAHQGAIVIHPLVEFGDDCLVRQGVTIGAARDDRYHVDYPTIGHRVQIGAGAAIVGKVHVGDDVLIGPNAVVTADVPDGHKVLAPPSVVTARRSVAGGAASRR
jgi:serine O-acetyltransferase